MATLTIAQIVKLYDEKLIDVARKSMENITDDVVDNTPVLDGQLKASWNPNNGEPQAKNQASGSPNYSKVISSIKPGDKYSVANGQPYGPRIEYEGWSQKAPNGMVQPAVAKWQQHVDAAVKEVK